MPIDPIAEQQKLLALKAYQTALANISRQRGQLFQSYGMTMIPQKTIRWRKPIYGPSGPKDGVAAGGSQKIIGYKKKKKIIPKHMDVDPKNPFGFYQMMLYGQGQELDQADQMSSLRGLGQEGLGGQQESQLKLGHNVQNIDFFRKLQDALYNLRQSKKQAKFDYGQTLVGLGLLTGQNYTGNIVKNL